MLVTNLLLYVNVVYLPELLGLIGITTTFQVGLFLAAMGITAAVTASQYDKIKKRLDYQEIAPISFLLWSAEFGLIFLTSSAWSYGVAVALFGIGQGLMLPTLMLWIGDVVSTSFLGRFSSYLTTFGFLGQFLSPIFFAPVSNFLGVNEVFLFASFVSIVGLALSSLNLTRTGGGIDLD